MHTPSLLNKRGFGRTQEAKAARYLRAQGLKLLCKNYHCRFGEIDLVMADAHTLVFVEVRFRRTAHFGSAIATVTETKQRKIRLTAADYLQRHPRYSACPCRFDVIGLSEDSDANAPSSSIDWVKNAFQ